MKIWQQRSNLKYSIKKLFNNKQEAQFLFQPKQQNQKKTRERGNTNGEK
jgi:hypothetical protein